MITQKAAGQLIIVGGGLLKEGGEPIIEKLAETTQKVKGPLVLVNAATYEPDGVFEQHIEVFKEFGVKQIYGVDIRTRADAHNEENARKCADAAVVLFTGGDQLRITSQMGDTPLFHCMRDRYANGGTIAGTSAGAAAMPETMLVSGPGDESSRISALSMAPGLGFLPDVVIDSHFAERGRIGRLLGAVTQNPSHLGLGIDESTAIVIDQGKSFHVIGAGGVYVLDGREIFYSSLSEKKPDGIISVSGVRLHVLSHEDGFDLVDRRPILPQLRRA